MSAVKREFDISRRTDTILLFLQVSWSRDDHQVDSDLEDFRMATYTV